jgi:hypothetical protein
MYCNLYERTLILINLPGATNDILTVPEYPISDDSPVLKFTNYPEVQEEINDNSQINEV